MTDVDKKVADGNLTQKEIIQLLLHNAQHMATREEVKTDILRVEDKVVNLATKEELSKVESTLKRDILRVEDKIVNLATKEELSKVESTLKQDISKVESTLKQDLSKVESTLKQDISKVSDKFDKIQWLIVATLLTVVFKDYLIALIK